MQIWDRDGDVTVASGRGAEAGHDALASHAPEAAVSHHGRGRGRAGCAGPDDHLGPRLAARAHLPARSPRARIEPSRPSHAECISHRSPLPRATCACRKRKPCCVLFQIPPLVSAALSAANRYSWLRRVGRGMQHTPRGPVSTVRLKRAETSVCGTQSHRVTGHCWNVTAWNAGSGGSGR